MAINWQLFDPEAGARLGAAFDPAVIAEKQNKLAALAQEREFNAMKMREYQQSKLAQQQAEARRQAALQEYATTGQATVPLEYNPDEIMASVQAMPDSPEKQQTIEAMKATGFGVPQTRALTPEEEYLRLQKLSIGAPDDAKLPLSMFEFREKQKEARRAQQEKIAAQQEMQQERLQAQEEARRDRAAMMRSGGASAPSWQVLQTDQGIVQVNPKTGEVRQLQNQGGMPLTKGSGAQPGTRPLTEGQAKAATFRSQMVGASNELDKLISEGKYDPTSYTAQSATGIAGGLGNIVTSAESQRAKQAQNQWAEAYLRFKTGAAATEGEVEQNRRTFFPVFGDSPAVVAQKKRAREQAEQDIGMAAGAGVAMGAKRTQPSGATGGWSIEPAQ